MFRPTSIPCVFAYVAAIRNDARVAASQGVVDSIGFCVAICIKNPTEATATRLKKLAVPICLRKSRFKSDVRLDRALYLTKGILWVALREGHSIWKIDLETEIIRHIAGTGKKGFSGDGGPATKGTFNGPKGIVVDAKVENVYVVDTENQALRAIHLQSGLLSSLAGYGPKGRGFNGEKVAAGKAMFGRPHGICVGPDGYIYTGEFIVQCS